MGLVVSMYLFLFLDSLACLKSRGIVSFFFGKHVTRRQVLLFPVSWGTKKFSAKSEKAREKMFWFFQTSLCLSLGTSDPPQICWLFGPLLVRGSGTVSRTCCPFLLPSYSGSQMSSCTSLFASDIVLKHEGFHDPYMPHCRIVLFFHCAAISISAARLNGWLSHTLGSVWKERLSPKL